jgi:hypothetical protein
MRYNPFVDLPGDLAGPSVTRQSIRSTAVVAKAERDAAR